MRNRIKILRRQLGARQSKASEREKKNWQQNRVDRERQARAHDLGQRRRRTHDSMNQ
jgi:hypothetical protein